MAPPACCHRTKSLTARRTRLILQPPSRRSHVDVRRPASEPSQPSLSLRRHRTRPRRSRLRGYRRDCRRRRSCALAGANASAPAGRCAHKPPNAIARPYRRRRRGPGRSRPVRRDRRRDRQTGRTPRDGCCATTCSTLVSGESTRTTAAASHADYARDWTATEPGTASYRSYMARQDLGWRRGRDAPHALTRALPTMPSKA